jgi:hypothetical protein
MNRRRAPGSISGWIIAIGSTEDLVSAAIGSDGHTAAVVLDVTHVEPKLGLKGWNGYEGREYPPPRAYLVLSLSPSHLLTLRRR